MDKRKVALGLGLFSIGLGLAELIGGKPLGRLLGIGKRSGLLRVFGAREIATGIGVLASRRKKPWLWARVAGDVLDLALLATALAPRNRRRTNAAAATASVLGVTALDIATGTGRT